MFSVRWARVVVSLLILIVLVFVGCQRSGDTSEAENAEVQIALQPLPLEEMLVVILTDAGVPVTDATVALEGNMNHAGMIPVLADAVSDDADGAADGRYHLPFTFTMLGDWIVTVTVTQADGASFSHNLEVRAGSEDITGDAVVPADAPQSHAADDHGGDAHETTLAVADARARPAPLAGGTGAVYFVLHNHGDAAVTLIGADSAAAAAVELHTTINDNGVMRMRQLMDGIEIPPGGSIELVPGGMHMMLVELTAPLVAGDSLDLTLHFAAADDLVVNVPVLDPDDFPAGEETEHQGEHD